MFTTILFSRGTAIVFLSSSSFSSVGATSFSNLARSRGRSLALCAAWSGAFCSCESFDDFLSFAISFPLPSHGFGVQKKLLAVSSWLLAKYSLRLPVRETQFSSDCLRLCQKLNANG